MDFIRRLARHGWAFGASTRSRGRHLRSAERQVPTRTRVWPPVVGRARVGETTEWLPLDHYVPQGRPAMVRPYLIAHERAQLAGAGVAR
ncbi:hypothetical protein CLV72_103672 [Allonocardiopsis opalescens]|uniref:Uncharacterized protein n=1 Tax=Allonocardiopsis opalescens TaxID=1144618 RepID=A0A2T0Q8F8_9ACTN|nr:hypothetical protein CLV72_103672 [Allonocardiopsis opalescens]